MRLPSLRRRRRKSEHGHLGTPPGTLIVDPDAPKPIIRVLSYGPKDAHEQPLTDLNELRRIIEQPSVSWISVEGFGDGSILKNIGQFFELHPLALEDVVSGAQRAKVEEFGKYQFIIAPLVRLVDDHIETRHLSIFVGKDFVLTFQERPDPAVESIRERIHAGKGRVRGAGHDYLTYCLLDAITDSYFPILDEYSDRLERLEDEVLNKPSNRVVSEIQGLRRGLLTLRRTIWPQRDLLGTLIREPTSFIRADSRAYIRDCYDHTVQIIDFVENYREICGALMEVYLSSVNLKMNEIMKVLTIISTIFIPLNFIAGIYGMNFNPQSSPWNMPELNWVWGYPFALSLMGLVTVGLLRFFWRRGWLSDDRILTKPPAQ